MIQNEMEKSGDPTYKKVVYREYDENFIQAKEMPKWNGLLGPILRAEVGDTLKVHFRNMADQPYSIHPQGIAYGKQSEGSSYADETSSLEKKDDSVSPGGEYTYVWAITEDNGPTNADPPCLTYTYYSHVNLVKDFNSGLIGVLLICKQGSLNEDGTQKLFDRDYVLMFAVFDERKSWHNSVKQGRLIYSVNGYKNGTVPDFEVCASDKISWHLVGMSSEPELFSIHFNGQVLEQKGHRFATISLITASSATANMTVINEGKWLISSLLEKHIKAGMYGYLNVVKCENKEIKTAILPISLKRLKKSWEYFIAAEEVTWDYAPNIPLYINKEYKSKYLEQGPTRIGKEYKKVVYRQYADKTFRNRTYYNDTESGILGPVIRAQIRDKITIVFKNMASRPYSMYPHGLSISKDYEGANYPADSSGKQIQKIEVKPNETYTYEWVVSENDGPTKDDPRCLTRMYHSAVDVTRDIASGLIGPLLICKIHSLDKRGFQVQADVEQQVVLSVFDENKSWYIEENIEKFCTSPSSVDKEDPEFYNSNVMHTINGFVYDSIPVQGFCREQLVYWHVSNVGSMDEIQSLHFNGHTFEHRAKNEDVLKIFPMTGDTVAMEMDNVGEWLYGSLSSHQKNLGMRLKFMDAVCPSYDSNYDNYNIDMEPSSVIQINYDQRTNQVPGDKPKKPALPDSETEQWADYLGLRTFSKGTLFAGDEMDPISWGDVDINNTDTLTTRTNDTLVTKELVPDLKGHNNSSPLSNNQFWTNDTMAMERGVPVLNLNQSQSFFRSGNRSYFPHFNHQKNKSVDFLNESVDNDTDITTQNSIDTLKDGDQVNDIVEINDFSDFNDKVNPKPFVMSATEFNKTEPEGDSLVLNEYGKSDSLTLNLTEEFMYFNDEEENPDHSPVSHNSKLGADYTLGEGTKIAAPIVDLSAIEENESEGDGGLPDNQKNKNITSLTQPACLETPLLGNTSEENLSNQLDTENNLDIRIQEYFSEELSTLVPDLFTKSPGDDFLTLTEVEQPRYDPHKMMDFEWLSTALPIETKFKNTSELDDNESLKNDSSLIGNELVPSLIENSTVYALNPNAYNSPMDANETNLKSLVQDFISEEDSSSISEEDSDKSSESFGEVHIYLKSNVSNSTRLKIQTTSLDPVKKQWNYQGREHTVEAKPSQHLTRYTEPFKKINRTKSKLNKTSSNLATRIVMKRKKRINAVGVVAPRSHKPPSKQQVQGSDGHGIVIGLPKGTDGDYVEFRADLRAAVENDVVDNDYTYDYETVEYSNPYTTDGRADVNKFRDPNDIAAHYLRTSKGNTKKYYIAAKEVFWNYAENKIAKQYRNKTSGRNRSKPKYKKVIFRSYTDSSFKSPDAYGEYDEHLGILGPVVRAEVGDVIQIVFRNLASRPYSLHAHGVSFDKSSEGAGYEDGSPEWFKEDNAIQPNNTYTYVWHVRSKSGPESHESACRAWVYYSSVDSDKDINSGLIGPLLICRKGTLDRSTNRPLDAREFVLLFMTFDETKSWYFKENSKENCKTFHKNSPEFLKCNRFHAINGVIFNLQGLLMYEDEPVRWHLINMGQPKDFQSIHFHGQTFTENRAKEYRFSVYTLLPGSFGTIEMRPSKPGVWLLDSEVGECQQAGMQALFHILDKGCKQAVGLDSGEITDAQITASEFIDGWEPRLARLNNVGRYNAWSTDAEGDFYSAWIQVDLERPMVIYSIATQGAKQFWNSLYIMEFVVRYSKDEKRWNYFKGNSNRHRKYFQGNSDAYGVKINTFDPPIIARYIRVYPTNHYKRPTLRMELYGCDLDACSLPLGMENGAIEKNQISASSFYKSFLQSWEPSLARLNTEGYTNAWQAESNNNDQWLQVDLLQFKKISGIITQGASSFGTEKFVRTFAVQHSSDGEKWIPYLKESTEKIFTGNVNSHGHVRNYFDPPIFARFIRIIPRTWTKGICLRLEILGCDVVEDL
ncbi:coagulation factor V [Latimeria chalumnae]|uniref:coagulation factor V n=1 Tax=Latimeria chalumnae TaxID=7897 RepID=UPI00313C5A82